MLFYGPKILATVIIIVLLSMIGIGNPKVVPVFALFFVAVFVGFYFLNKTSRERERSAKSNSKFMLAMQIAGIVFFVAIMSLIGVMANHSLTGNIIGYIAWFIIFSAIIVGILMMIKGRQRHFELVKSNPIYKKIFSVSLGVLSILIPVLILVMGKFLPIGEGKMVIAVVLSFVGVALFVALIGAAFMLMNKWSKDQSRHTLGYALIVVAALLPGLFVVVVSKDSVAFAGTYMAALLALVMSYMAIDLGTKEH